MAVTAPTALAPAGAAREKFGFDTVFEATGEIISAAPRPKRTYSADEVEAIRRAAEAAGETRALTGVANRQAQALAVIAQAAQQALPGLTVVAHDHRIAAADLRIASTSSAE